METRGSRRKKDSDDQDSRPFTKTDLLHLIPPIIEDRKPFGSEIPPFTRKFLRFQQPGTPLRVLEEFEGEVVKFVETSDVSSSLATWIRSFEWHPDWWRFELLLSPRHCEEIAKAWLTGFTDNRLAVLPRAVRFKSDPGLCFHRLPFDLMPRETLEAPAWAEILSRLTNAEAFAMRVASMFDPEAARRQVVWMYGPAKSGKSVILETLARLMGDSYTALDSEFDRFWKAPLVGKRMVIVNESGSKFLRDDRFKAITGDDLHLINDKAEKKFTATMEVIMFFASNEKPHIPNDEAFLSRVIDCRVSPLPPGTRRKAKVAKEALWREMEAFVGWGWHLYTTKTDEMGLIPSDQSELTDVAEEYEGDALDFLHRHFVMAPGQHVLAVRVDELMKSRWITLSNQQIAEWRAVWEREGVPLRRPEVDGQRVRVYVGVRLRTDAERASQDMLR